MNLVTIGRHRTVQYFTASSSIPIDRVLEKKRMTMIVPPTSHRILHLQSIISCTKSSIDQRASGSLFVEEAVVEWNWTRLRQISSIDQLISPASLWSFQLVETDLFNRPIDSDLRFEIREIDDLSLLRHISIRFNIASTSINWAFPDAFVGILPDNCRLLRLKETHHQVELRLWLQIVNTYSSSQIITITDYGICFKLLHNSLSMQ